MQNILIADDHFVIQIGMKYMIEVLVGFCTIDFAKDGDEVQDLVTQKEYDLVILDINMPKSDGVSLVKFILDKRPKAKIIIHTVASEELYALRYYYAGAMGFLPKSSEPDVTKAAIQMVMSGKRYFSKQILNEISLSLLKVDSENPFSKLSNRELEIASQLIKGHGLTEIANKLDLKKTTVSTHKIRIFEKLNVKSVIQMLELAKVYHYEFDQ